MIMNQSQMLAKIETLQDNIRQQQSELEELKKIALTPIITTMRWEKYLEIYLKGGGNNKILAIKALREDWADYRKGSQYDFELSLVIAKHWIDSLVKVGITNKG